MRAGGRDLERPSGSTASAKLVEVPREHGGLVGEPEPGQRRSARAHSSRAVRTPSQRGHEDRPRSRGAAPSPALDQGGAASCPRAGKRGRSSGARKGRMRRRLRRRKPGRRARRSPSARSRRCGWPGATAPGAALWRLGDAGSSTRRAQPTGSEEADGVVLDAVALEVARHQRARSRWAWPPVGLGRAGAGASPRRCPRRSGSARAAPGGTSRPPRRGAAACAAARRARGCSPASARSSGASAADGLRERPARAPGLGAPESGSGTRCCHSRLSARCAPRGASLGGLSAVGRRPARRDQRVAVPGHLRLGVEQPARRRGQLAARPARAPAARGKPVARRHAQLHSDHPPSSIR